MASQDVHDQDLRGRVGRLSLEQKVQLVTGADFWALYPAPDAGLQIGRAHV